MLFGTMRLGDREGRRIEMINPDGTGLETVLTLDEGEQIHAGRISADGEHLAYSASQPGRKTPDLWLLTTDRVRRKIADDLIVVAWSPDGRRIAAIRDTDPKTPGRENLIIDVKTGHEQRLPIPKEDAVDDWSPDGKTLAVMAGNVDKVFEHPTKGTYPLRQIYLINPDGTGAAPLTTRPLSDSLDARFSPDGSRSPTSRGGIPRASCCVSPWCNGETAPTQGTSRSSTRSTKGTSTEAERSALLVARRQVHRLVRPQEKASIQRDAVRTAHPLRGDGRGDPTRPPSARARMGPGHRLAMMVSLDRPRANASPRNVAAEFV